MKLRQLTIENIASLRGKHYLDFDKLSDINLFAITGATGSGKSTLLAAISLALYGKSHKKSLNSVDLITTGQNGGSVELTFSFKGIDYKAYWRCKARKNNGELLKTPSILRNFYKNGEPTDMLPEDVLQLSFDQFSKTVILNQGEFSRFLLSSFNERKDILESLTSWDSLSHIHPNVKSSIKNVSNIIEDEKLILENISIASQEKIDETIKIIPEQEEYLSYSSAVVEKSNSILSVSKSTLELFKKYASFNDKSKQHTRSIEQEQEKYNLSLQNLSKTEVFFQKKQQAYNDILPKLNEGITLLQKMKHSNVKCQEIQKIIQSETNSLKKYNDQSKANLNKKEMLQKSLDDSANKKEQTIWTNIQVNDLAKSFNTFKELLNNIKVSDLSINNINNLMTSQETKIQTISKEITEIENSSEINSEDSLKSYDHLIEKKNQLNLDLGELNAAYKNYIVQCQQINNNTFRIVALIADQKIKKSELAILEGKIHLNELKWSISICSEEAQKTGNCPVCNDKFNESTSHLGKSTLEIEEVKLCRDNIDQVKNQLASIKTKISETKIQTDDFENKRQLDCGILKSFEKKYEVISDSVDDICHLGKQLLIQINQSIIDYEKKLSKMRQLQERKKQIQLVRIENLSDINKNKEILSNFKKDRFNLDQAISESFDILQSKLGINVECFDEFINLFQDIQKKGQEIERIKTNLAEADTLHKSLKNFINTSNEKVVQHLKMIEEENLQVSLYKTKFNELDIDNDPGATKLDLENVVSKARSTRDQAQRSLHSVELELNQSKQILKNIKDNISSITSTILGDFSKLSEIESSIPGFYKIIPSLNDSPHDLANVLAVYVNKIVGMSLDSPIEIIDGLFLELQKIDNSSSELVKQSKIINEEYIHNKFLIKTHTESLRKQEKIHIKIKSHQRNLTRWKKLLLILGKNRDEFRNFALSLIEEKLTVQANLELQSLCEGRYRITTIPSTHGNEYYICDKYMGGEMRKVTTLSGGEIFLISLAMALSLAELTRGKTEIDSFFIDEGFGTLDDDAIEEVIETLLSLRNRGKQIGLISHIQKLTNRVPVNIHLQKGHLGESHIEMVYH